MSTFRICHFATLCKILEDKTIFLPLFWKTKLPAITLEGCKYYKKRRLEYRARTFNSDLGVELGNVQESLESRTLILVLYDDGG